MIGMSKFTLMRLAGAADPFMPITNFDNPFSDPPSPPPAPDYTGAAQASAQSSKEVTNINNYANRPTINTPWGSQTWTTTPVTDPATGQTVTQWTQNTNLTPESQRALDSQLAMQQGRSDIANSLMDSAKEAITTPIDYSSFSAYGSAPKASNFNYLGAAPTLETGFTSQYGLPSEFAAKNLPTMMDSIDKSGVSKLPEFDRQYVNDMFNESLQYMRPDQERQQSSLEAKLINQGLTRGSEAYNNSYRQMMDQQSRDKYNALQVAMNQGNQMFQNQLSGNNQTFNQALQDASFRNAANNQAFGQQNQTWQNNFNLGNTAFNQAYQTAAFKNNALAQQQGIEQNIAQFNNTNMQNEFSQQQAISNYQNQMRQAQIAEAQQRQLQPLNNINALISGQQVSMPQMPTFNANQAAQPVNYLGAAQAQGNYNLQQQQMNNASSNSAMSGMFGLGGSLLGAAGAAGGFAPLFGMSDKRLKRDITKIGVLGKFNLYKYRFLWSDDWEVGVMAQEVKKVMPEAVKRLSNGYYAVNYAMIGA